MNYPFKEKQEMDYKENRFSTPYRYEPENFQC